MIIGSLLLGIVLILNGILLIIQPKFYSSKYHQVFDFTGMEWPYGGIQIILGALFIWSVFRKRMGLTNRTMMCPTCIKPFEIEHPYSEDCPVCGNILEDLSGFYDRHPELKEDKT